MYEPRKNVTAERYRFRKMKQALDESIEDYKNLEMISKNAEQQNWRFRLRHRIIKCSWRILQQKTSTKG